MPLIAASAFFALASSLASQSTPRRAEPVALVGVNVIPMDSARVLTDQTVLVRDAKISAIGPRGRVSTSGARTFELRGYYLLPGLADLHTHPQVAGDLTQYMASGVTTILSLGSFVDEQLLRWRDSTRRGERIGPDIYVGYYVDGPGGPAGRTIVSAEDGRNAARNAKTGGFDFIKAYNSIPEAAFIGLVEEARAQGIAVTGHGVRSVGLQRGFALGQVLVAHGEEFMYTHFNRLDDSVKFGEVAAWTKRSGAYVLPNLSAYVGIARQWGKPPVVDTLLSLPDARYLDPIWRQRWRGRDYVTRQGSLDPRVRFLKRFMKVLSDSGVPLLAGTDSPTIPGLFPGFSIVDDIALLVDAGLTPYQALATATRVPGEFFAKFGHASDRVGTIAVGNRADLIVVRSNPLEDVRRLRNPTGVMLRGHWISRVELDERMSALAGANARQ